MSTSLGKQGSLPAQGRRGSPGSLELRVRDRTREPASNPGQRPSQGLAPPHTPPASPEGPQTRLVQGSAWLSSLIKLAEEEGGPHEQFLEVSREIPHTVRRTSPGEAEGDVRSPSPGEVEGALRLGRVWPERRPVSSGCQAEHPGFPQRESWGPGRCGPRSSHGSHRAVTPLPRTDSGVRHTWRCVKADAGLEPVTGSRCLQGVRGGPVDTPG